MTDTDRQAAIAALQARRAARGMTDPLNRLRAVVAASDSPAIVEQPAPHVVPQIARYEDLPVVDGEDGQEEP